MYTVYTHPLLHSQLNPCVVCDFFFVHVCGFHMLLDTTLTHIPKCFVCLCAPLLDDRHGHVIVYVFVFARGLEGTHTHSQVKLVGCTLGLSLYRLLELIAQKLGLLSIVVAIRCVLCDG